MDSDMRSLQKPNQIGNTPFGVVHPKTQCGASTSTLRPSNAGTSRLKVAQGRKALAPMFKSQPGMPWHEDGRGQPARP